MEAELARRPGLRLTLFGDLTIAREDGAPLVTGADEWADAKVKWAVICLALHHDYHLPLARLWEYLNSNQLPDTNAVPPDLHEDLLNSVRKQLVSANKQLKNRPVPAGAQPSTRTPAKNWIMTVRKEVQFRAGEVSSDVGDFRLAAATAQEARVTGRVDAGERLLQAALLYGGELLPAEQDWQRSRQQQGRESFWAFLRHERNALRDEFLVLLEQGRRVPGWDDLLRRHTDDVGVMLEHVERLIDSRALGDRACRIALASCAALNDGERAATAYRRLERRGQPDAETAQFYRSLAIAPPTHLFPHQADTQAAETTIQPAKATAEDERALGTYLARLERRTRFLDFADLQGLGHTRSIQLDAGFIEPRVALADPDTLWPNRLLVLRRWATYEVVVLAGQYTPDEREEHRRQLLGCAPAPTTQDETLTLAAALALHPILVVLGEPGSGKTVAARLLARRLALAYAQAERQDEQGGVPPALPVLLDAVDYAAALRRPQPPDLLDYLGAQPDLSARFRAHLAGQRLILIVDGLDDLPADADRAAVVAALNAFGEEARGTTAPPGGGNRVIVFSRLAGYAAYPLRHQELGHVVLAPLTAQQIAEYCRSWPQTDVLAALLASPRAEVGDLARNPRTLVLLALATRHEGPLPEGRVPLHALILENLLALGACRQAWRQGSPPARSTLLQIAEELALRVQGRGHLGLLTPPEVSEVVAQGIAPETTEVRDRALGFLADCGIIAVAEGGGVGFLAPSLQTYLVGRALTRQPGVVALLLEQIGQPGWTTAIDFALGHAVTSWTQPRWERLVADLLNVRRGQVGHNQMAVAIALLPELGPFSVATVERLTRRLLASIADTQLGASTHVAAAQRAFARLGTAPWHMPTATALAAATTIPALAPAVAEVVLWGGWDDPIVLASLLRALPDDDPTRAWPIDRALQAVNRRDRTALDAHLPLRRFLLDNPDQARRCWRDPRWLRVVLALYGSGDPTVTAIDPAELWRDSPLSGVLIDLLQRGASGDDLASALLAIVQDRTRDTAMRDQALFALIALGLFAGDAQAVPINYRSISPAQRRRLATHRDRLIAMLRPQLSQAINLALTEPLSQIERLPAGHWEDLQLALLDFARKRGVSVPYPLERILLGQQAGYARRLALYWAQFLADDPSPEALAASLTGAANRILRADPAALVRSLPLVGATGLLPAQRWPQEPFVPTAVRPAQRLIDALAALADLPPALDPLRGWGLTALAGVVRTAPALLPEMAVIARGIDAVEQRDAVLALLRLDGDPVATPLLRLLADGDDPDALLGVLRDVARTLPGAAERARLWWRAAALLPPRQREHAMLEVHGETASIRNPASRSRMLWRLARIVPLDGSTYGRTFSAAKRAAGRISEPDQRACALARLLPLAPPAMRPRSISQIIGALRLVGDEYERAHLTRQMLPALNVAGIAMRTRRTLLSSFADPWCAALAASHAAASFLHHQDHHHQRMAWAQITLAAVVSELGDPAT